MTEQKISFTQAILMGANVMLGAGILAGPGPMAKVAGNASFLGWGLAAILAFPMVYCAARLAGIVPGSGGLYAYCKKGFGNAVGFYSGWLYFLCYLCAVAGLLSAFRDFLKISYPSIQLFTYPALFCAIVLLFVCSLNLLRVALISRIQSYLTLIKATPVVFAIALLPFFFKTNFTVPMTDVANLPLALTFSLFGYMGFEFCCNLGHLVKGGAQAAKNAVLCGFFGVVILYTFFHFSLLQIMGAENLGNSLVAGYPQFVMSKFLSLGTVLVYVIFATTILTYFNSANVLVFLCTTIVHALSSDKKLRFYSFWNKLSESGRPRNILFSVACAAVFVGSVVTVTAHLFTACLFGLSCLMIVVMLSLLRVDDNPTFVSRFIAIIGIIVSCMLICYHWVRSGETICEKLITFSPIFVGMFVGVLLRLQGDDDTSIHRNPISIERQTIVKDLLTCSESENSD